MSDPVAQFMAVTNASAADAAAYLEATGGDVDAAVEAFFDAGGGGGGSAEPAVAPAAPAAAPAPAPAPRRAPAPASNVRSLADLAADRPSDDDDDDDGANEYYAGGGEHSGQVVKGAPKDAAALFDAARAAGARDGTAADLGGGGGGGSNAPGAFTGVARTLAGGAAPAAPPPPPADAAAPPAAPTVITFYDDGVFTVGDGPPRAMDDPAEAEFMAALARGECPAELDPGPAGGGVAVNLVRAGKPYEPPPKPAYVAFSGTGHTLAGPSSSAPPAAAAPAAASTQWTGPDESRPTTSLQLRLADGSRLVARFNTDATLADVRAFIAAARPGGPAAYTLLAGVPPVPVDEGSGDTLEAAGLLNTVLTQKL